MQSLHFTVNAWIHQEPWQLIPLFSRRSMIMQRSCLDVAQLTPRSSTRSPISSPSLSNVPEVRHLPLSFHRPSLPNVLLARPPLKQLQRLFSLWLFRSFTLLLLLFLRSQPKNQKQSAETLCNMPALCPGSYVRNVNEPLLPPFFLIAMCDDTQEENLSAVLGCLRLLQLTLAFSPSKQLSVWPPPWL